LAIWLLVRLASRTAIWPFWVTISGYVVAVLQLVSFYSLPLLLLPIWVMIATLRLRGTADPMVSNPAARRRR
jgi:hypothetical protein